MNLSMKRRQTLSCRQNQVLVTHLGPVRREPDNLCGRRPVYRRRELDAGDYTELQEPVAPMQRKKLKRPKPQGQSTDAEHWGGPTRRSDEGSVMGPEQRGRVRRLHGPKQLATG